MKKYSNFGAAFLLSAALFSNSFAQTKPKTSDEAGAIKTNKPVKVETIEQDVAEALTLIEDKHIGGSNINYNDLFKSTIDSMLHTLDPHSNYYDAKEFEAFRTEQRSQYFGIGALLGDLSDKDGKTVATYIRATFEGAPANRAGLLYGDKIVDVNGTSMLGKSFSEVRTFLIGARGTTAKVTVERYGSGKRDTVEIVRDAVSQPSVPEAYMLRPGIGYIAMTGGFHQTTYDEFRLAMQKLKAEGMQQLVLDLRNNPGGLVNQAEKVAKTFLGQGERIFNQKGRIDGASNLSISDNPNPDNTPIVLLVNRNSASASEILAGALQDHDRALVVGESTFGKGLVTNPFPLEYGSMLLLTIAKYETPSGRLVQRDYSDGSLYDYYNEGGTLRTEDTVRPKGAESKTDAGRSVFSGNGITPDETAKSQTITVEKARFQRRLNDPIFSFALDLAYGKIKGFAPYQVNRPISFDYDLKKTDFPVNETIYQAFKTYATTKYNFTSAQVDREREFVERTLRTELVTAAYGSTTSFQVFNDYDTQLKRAIDLLPQAKQLALLGAKANAEKLKTNNSQ